MMQNKNLPTLLLLSACLLGPLVFGNNQSIAPATQSSAFGDVVEAEHNVPGKKGQQKRKSRTAPEYPQANTAWSIADIVLGRPTDTSIAVNIIMRESAQGYVEYGLESVAELMQTPVQSLEVGSPVLVELTELEPSAQYRYRLRYQINDTEIFHTGPWYRINTAKAPGDSFSFQLQGDSHPERTPKQHLPAMYEQTLRQVAADQPDFYLTLGDDFSVDTLKEWNRASVEGVYSRQLTYLALVGHSSPLFLVNGNHEQAAKYLLDGSADNVPVWAQNARNRLYPQPAPNAFYSGNQTPVEHIGLLRNYFAWHWGDALFVVIDPYWHSDAAVDNHISGEKKKRDLWDITLGDSQYQWLSETLSGSSAKYKFVFAHHVNGTGRGGVIAAPFFEWGGNDLNGHYQFTVKRPEWQLPIHDLMVANGVSVFFQGHDHVFATEKLDGVIYQTLPEPADPNYQLYFADQYQGTVLPNSGRVRVNVTPEQATIEYVLTVMPEDETESKQNNSVAYRYVVQPNEVKTNEQ